MLMYEVGMYWRAEPGQQLFLTLLFTCLIYHEKIISDIWQHSFTNRLYLLLSTYESEIKICCRSYIFQISITYFFSVVRGIA